MKKAIVLAICMMPLVSFGSTDLNVQSDVQTETFDNRKKRKRQRRRWNRKHGAPKSKCNRVRRVK